MENEKVLVEVCVGTSCHLMGSGILATTIEELPSQIAKKIELKLSLCFGVCHGEMTPPIVRINGIFYDEVTPTLLKKILTEIVGESA